MKICFIPIDNRPVCYNLAEDIASIENNIEFFIPPRSYLGDLTKSANIDKLLDWLKKCPKSDAIIISLDTIAYGGLIPSRRSEESFEVIKSRIECLKQILLEKQARIYGFSSIMRISNNNYNEEEKEYWKDYGEKIFEYSFSGGKNKSDIPDAIINDYLATRKRNFEINKLYLQWQKEGLFDTLIFSKDDCAEFGFNVEEAKELELLGAKTKTGADEIPLSLLSRAIRKDIKIFVEYTEPEFKHLISNYEDVSIEKSVLEQLELGGFEIADKEEDANIILIVNNFKVRQGEHVMGWATELYNKTLKLPKKPYAIADVRFANGADNNFVKQLLSNLSLENFYGYSGWNTSANTLGSLLACIKFKYKAKKYNDDNFNKLQIIRFLDDWAYQANIRKKIEKPSNISVLMKKYEDILSKTFKYNYENQIQYTYPWNRKFEIEINL